LVYFTNVCFGPDYGLLCDRLTKLLLRSVVSKLNFISKKER
jgi:hypothetical protein